MEVSQRDVLNPYNVRRTLNKSVKYFPCCLTKSVFAAIANENKNWNLFFIIITYVDIIHISTISIKLIDWYKSLIILSKAQFSVLHTATQSCSISTIFLIHPCNIVIYVLCKPVSKQIANLKPNKYWIRNLGNLLIEESSAPRERCESIVGHAHGSRVACTVHVRVA